jgi:hypothetical protein
MMYSLSANSSLDEGGRLTEPEEETLNAQQYFFQKQHQFSIDLFYMYITVETIQTPHIVIQKQRIS